MVCSGASARRKWRWLVRRIRPGARLGDSGAAGGHRDDGETTGIATRVSAFDGRGWSGDSGCHCRLAWRCRGGAGGGGEEAVRHSAARSAGQGLAPGHGGDPTHDRAGRAQPRTSTWRPRSSRRTPSGSCCTARPTPTGGQEGPPAPVPALRHRGRLRAASADRRTGRHRAVGLARREVPLLLRRRDGAGRRAADAQAGQPGRHRAARRSWSSTRRCRARGSAPARSIRSRRSPPTAGGWRSPRFLGDGTTRARRSG